MSLALSTVLFSAANAMAVTPDTWEDPDANPTLTILTFTVAAPVTLFLVIAGLVAISNLKAKHHSPEIPSREVDTVQH